MTMNLNKQFAFILLSLASISAYAGCGGKGQKDCAAAVITPDILKGTAQSPAKQSNAPAVPTANQLTPAQVPQAVPQPIAQATPQLVPQAIPQQVPQMVPQAVPQAVPQPIPQAVPQLQAMPSQVLQQVPQMVPQQVPQPVPQVSPPVVQQQIPQPIPQAVPALVTQQLQQQVVVAPPPQAQSSTIYFEKMANGVTRQLPADDVTFLRNLGYIQPDGTLSQRAVDNGFSMQGSVAVIAPPQPSPMRVPNLRPADPVPPKIQPVLYFETHSGVTTQLTPSQVDRLIAAGSILPDGSVKASVAQIVTAVPQSAPYIIPPQPQTPNLAPPNIAPPKQPPITYFETHNGPTGKVTARLSQDSVDKMKASGVILPDGSIKAASAGFVTAVPQKTPELIPPVVPQVEYFRTVVNGPPARLSPTDVQRLIREGDIRPDGSVGPRLASIVHRVEQKAPQLAPPQPDPIKVPGPAQVGAIPTPMQSNVPNRLPQQPDTMKVPGPAQAFPVPTPTISPIFYFATYKGVTKVLTPEQLRRLRNSGQILPDGTLTAKAIQEGFSAVAQTAPAVLVIAQPTPVMLSANTPLVISNQEAPTSASQAVNPSVEVTDKASSAMFNQEMIANNPGRQSPLVSAVFKNETTGQYRECIVSGLERRKIVNPNGEDVYRGSLPSFRTVSVEVADIPSWHPHEAGCIISMQHRQ